MHILILLDYALLFTDFIQQVQFLLLEGLYCQFQGLFFILERLVDTLQLGIVSQRLQSFDILQLQRLLLVGILLIELTSHILQSYLSLLCPQRQFFLFLLQFFFSFLEHLFSFLHMLDLFFVNQPLVIDENIFIVHVFLEVSYPFVQSLYVVFIQSLVLFFQAVYFDYQDVVFCFFGGQTVLELFELDIRHFLALTDCLLMNILVLRLYFWLIIDLFFLVAESSQAQLQISLRQMAQLLGLKYIDDLFILQLLNAFFKLAINITKLLILTPELFQLTLKFKDFLRRQNLLKDLRRVAHGVIKYNQIQYDIILEERNKIVYRQQSKIS